MMASGHERAADAHARKHNPEERDSARSSANISGSGCILLSQLFRPKSLPQ